MAGDVPEKKNFEDELKQLKNRYEGFINSANCIFWEADAQTFQFTFVSRQAESILGYSMEEWKKPNFWVNILHPGDRARVISFCKKEISKKRDYRLEYRVIAADGRTVWLEDVVTVVVENDKSAKIIGIKADITVRKRVERALKVLNKVNHAIIHANDEKELLNEVCRIVVEECGYCFAWIGYVEADKKIVKLVANSEDDDYAETIRLTWGEIEAEDEPAGTVIREKKVVVERDIATAPGKPWCEGALKRCYASSITLPLIYKNEVLGVLSIYATEKDAFDDVEVKLLQELVDDLSYGIAMLRVKRERERMQRVMNALWQIATTKADYKTLREYALNEIIQLTNSKYGFFGLMSEDDEKLTTLAWSKDIMEDCKIPAEIHVFPVREGGIWADAVKEKKIIIVNDYESYPDKKGFPEGHIPLTRLLVVPVIAEGRVASLAAVANKDTDYTEEDAELIRIFLTNIQQLLDKIRLEELYETVVKNTGTAMLIVDEDITITFANDEVEKLFGLPKEKVVGKRCTEFVARDEREKMLEYYKLINIDPSLVPESFEVKLIDAKNNIKHTILTISTIPNTKSYIVTFLDVTELKEAERKLKDSEAKYRMLFEKSRDAIVLTGVDGRIIDCNDASLKMFGVSKEEVVGRTFIDLDLIEEKDIFYLMELFYRGMREEIGSVEIRVKVGQQIKWLEVSSTLLKRDGKPYAFLNIIRDITERKRYERDLKESAERLRILHELDKGVIEGKSFREIAKTALRSIREPVKCDVIALFIYNSEEEDLEIAAVETAEDIQQIHIEFSPASFRSLSDIKRGKIIKTDNLLNLNEFTDLEREFLKVGIRSYMHVPLIVRDEFIGILCLSSRKIKAFDEKLEFIEGTSAQLALALHEARLFEMRKRAFEQIEKNIEEFAILVDHIRNPLAIIHGIAETKVDDKDRIIIFNQIEKILETIKRLDEGWLESEDIRKFLFLREVS
jgi:PAS domain S-box-containing protein